MKRTRIIGCRIYQRALATAMHFIAFPEPFVISEKDSLKKVAPYIISKGYRNPLIVTDSTILSLGLSSPLEASLKENGLSYALYSGVIPNPTFQVVIEAKELYLSYNCDCLIALGGGSSMDAAKAAGALISNRSSSLLSLKGVLKVKKRPPLLIAIPTTAGTGSEATVAAVVVDERNHNKFSINDPHLIPDCAVLDDSLLKGLPKKVISTTGVDALTHAVESYIGHARTRKTKAYALEATSLISKSLFAFYSDPNNDEARQNMQKAAYLAGVSFTRSYVGYVHALAHALGGKYNVPHGLANAILLPVVLERYGKKCQKRLAELALAAGLGKDLQDEEKLAKSFIYWIKEENSKLGIPMNFGGLIKEEDIPALAKTADKEANPLYPVPLELDAEELSKIYMEVK